MKLPKSLLVVASGVMSLTTRTSADTTPEQVHLACAGQNSVGDTSGFTFVWYTEDNTTSTPCVEYVINNATKTATGSSLQYLEDFGFHHSVRVTDLPADTQVTYRVGNANDGWSPYFAAKTAPGKDTTRAVKVSIFGDMGWSDSDKRPMEIVADGLVKHWSATYSRQSLEMLKDNGDIEMVWHVGDIGYMDDAFAHDVLQFSYESAYNGYLNWLQNLTSIMPYMVSPGNHESECHSPVCLAEEKRAQALSNFTAFNSRWRMPSEESGGHPGSNMWYSWNYGPVHFVSLDTETDWPGAGEEHVGDSGIPWLRAGSFGHDGEYLAWLENDLKVCSMAKWLKMSICSQRGHSIYYNCHLFSMCLFVWRSTYLMTVGTIMFSTFGSLLPKPARMALADHGFWQAATGPLEKLKTQSKRCS